MDRGNVGRSLSGAFASLALVITACGTPARPASAPSSVVVDDEPAPSSIAEAEAQIARARTALAPSDGAKAGPSSSTEEPASASPAPPPDHAKCANPCRAIASMRRAVASLCRLTGESDARCIDARTTLAASEKRLDPRCGC